MHLARDRPAVPGGIVRCVQRAAGDHRHRAAVPRDEILGELGQQLTGGGLIRPVGTIEEANVHDERIRP